MLKNIGMNELLVIAALVLLLFGGKKIPEFVRGIANAIKEYRQASKE